MTMRANTLPVNFRTFSTVSIIYPSFWSALSLQLDSMLDALPVFSYKEIIYGFFSGICSFVCLGEHERALTMLWLRASTEICRYDAKTNVFDVRSCFHWCRHQYKLRSIIGVRLLLQLQLRVAIGLKKEHNRIHPGFKERAVLFLRTKRVPRGSGFSSILRRTFT